MSKWKCATCMGENKPNPVPGLVNRFLVTVAEFCSDTCRDVYINAHDMAYLFRGEGVDKFHKLLDMIWDQPALARKVDWMGMETLLTEILRDVSLTAEQKVKLTKECIDAYTRRNHFPELWKDGKRA